MLIDLSNMVDFEKALVLYCVTKRNDDDDRAIVFLSEEDSDSFDHYYFTKFLNQGTLLFNTYTDAESFITSNATILQQHDINKVSIDQITLEATLEKVCAIDLVEKALKLSISSKLTKEELEFLNKKLNF